MAGSASARLRSRGRAKALLGPAPPATSPSRNGAALDITQLRLPLVCQRYLWPELDGFRTLQRRAAPLSQQLDQMFLVRSEYSLAIVCLFLYTQPSSIPHQYLISSTYPRIGHRSVSPRSNLLRLPDELLAAIFAHVTCLEDAACLCLADGRLCAVGFPVRINELQDLTYAKWAGNRIVCIGINVSGDDLDEEVLTVMQRQLEQCDLEDQTKSLPRWLNMACEKFVSYEGQQAGGSETLADSKRFGEDWEPYQEMIPKRYESSHPWMLCNLCKGVYVRASAVAALTCTDGSVPFIVGAACKPLSLVHVMLVQTCWFSYEITGLDNQGKLHPGPWAGDRLEVTSMDKLNPSIPWKDVSDEVTGTVDKLWQSRFGVNWKGYYRRGCPWWAVGSIDTCSVHGDTSSDD